MEIGRPGLVNDGDRRLRHATRARGLSSDTSWPLMFLIKTGMRMRPFGVLTVFMLAACACMTVGGICVQASPSVRLKTGLFLHMSFTSLTPLLPTPPKSTVGTSKIRRRRAWAQFHISETVAGSLCPLSGGRRPLFAQPTRGTAAKTARECLSQKRRREGRVRRGLGPRGRGCVQGPGPGEEAIASGPTRPHGGDPRWVPARIPPAFAT